MATPFAALEAKATATTYRHLANASVVAGAQTFDAFLDEADADVFDGVGIMPGMTLRYQRESVELLPNAAITVNGVAYTVLGAPKAINRLEMVAGLLKAA